jgi:hypothetical protein
VEWDGVVYVGKQAPSKYRAGVDGKHNLARWVPV